MLNFEFNEIVLVMLKQHVPLFSDSLLCSEIPALKRLYNTGMVGLDGSEEGFDTLLTQIEFSDEAIAQCVTRLEVIEMIGSEIQKASKIIVENLRGRLFFEDILGIERVWFKPGILMWDDPIFHEGKWIWRVYLPVKMEVANALV